MLNGFFTVMMCFYGVCFVIDSDVVLCYTSISSM